MSTLISGLHSPEMCPSFQHAFIKSTDRFKSGLMWSLLVLPGPGTSLVLGCESGELHTRKIGCSHSRKNHITPLLAVTPCGFVYRPQRFGGICCLHFHNRRGPIFSFCQFEPIIFVPLPLPSGLNCVVSNHRILWFNLDSSLLILQGSLVNSTGFVRVCRPMAD